MISDYERANEEIVPAARLLLIKELKKRYNMKEKDIADRLGIAQAAVSKYLNNKCSEKITRIASKIDAKYLDMYIAKVHEGGTIAADMYICSVCKALNDFGCKFANTPSA